MATRPGHHQLPKQAVEAAKRRRAVFLFTIFVTAIALLIFWGWGRETRREQRNEIYGQSGDQPDAGEGAVLDELPQTPTRDEVAKTLRDLNPLVSLCSEGKGGVIRVHLAITGKTGLVKEATVIKQFAGSKVADCVTDIVSRAQFPRFKKKTLTVVFPYTFPEPLGDGGFDELSSDGGLDASSLDGAPVL